MRLIVNYLSIQRIDDPSNPKVDPLTAPEAKRQEWFCLLEHYGLTSFFTKSFSPFSPFSPLDVAKTSVEQPHGSLVSTQRVGDSLQLSHEGSSNAHHFVGCTPCMVPGMQPSWKVRNKNRLFQIDRKNKRSAKQSFRPNKFWMDVVQPCLCCGKQSRLDRWLDRFHLRRVLALLSRWSQVNHV
jgi:hypothetical protein